MNCLKIKCILLLCTGLFTLSTSTYSNKGLFSVPSGISPETVTLDLSTNQIQIFDPEKLKGLSKLQTLKVNQNLLMQFVNLTYVKETLTELQMNSNKISSIESGLLDILTKLNILKLRGNKLHTFPDVYGPSNTLQELDLRMNNFSTFPSLKILGKNIQKLYLDTNIITDIKLEDTEGLHGIKLLSVAKNLLNIFPDVSNIVDTLNEIDLTDNRINYVPDNRFIFAANYSSEGYKLRINLSRNNLTGLPPLGGTVKNIDINLMLNPLHCDAKMAWMLGVTGIKYEYFTDNDDPDDDQVFYWNSLEETSCESPDGLKGKPLSSLTYTDLILTELPKEVMSTSSLSSKAKDNFYSISTKVTHANVVSRLECHSLCFPELGCSFYNLKCTGENKCLCHYSDPLSGEVISEQPDNGQGWAYYSVV